MATCGWRCQSPAIFRREIPAAVGSCGREKGVRKGGGAGGIEGEGKGGLGVAFSTLCLSSAELQWRWRQRASVRLGFRKSRREARGGIGGCFYRGFGIGKGQRFKQNRQICGVPIGFGFVLELVSSVRR
jgi:hypothetical protein